MRKISMSMSLAGASVLLLAGCSADVVDWASSAQGVLDCKALDVDYTGSARHTRATEANGVNVNDFTVEFLDCEGKAAKTYTYSQMPDIVMLPVGTYTVRAHYGDNTQAGWDSPYYEGSSTQFEIRKNEITTVPQTVVCRLSNIRVQVNIENFGTDTVSDDTTVTVAVGEAGTTLVFDKSTLGKSAYFPYVAGSSSIAATFEGTVYGDKISANHTYNDAAPGNAYIINFRITRPDNVQDGDITLGDGGIDVDTTVDVKEEIEQ